LTLQAKGSKKVDVEQTTIRINTETRDRLMALGKKGETYEEIIRELLNFYEGVKASDVESLIRGTKG